MNDLNQWQQSNARQLGDALAALRQRLENYIQRQSPPAPAAKPMTPVVPAAKPALIPAPSVSPAAATKTVSRSLIQRLLGSASDGAKAPPTAPSTEEPTAAKEPTVTEAKAELTDPPSALSFLSQRLGLSLFEQNVLLLWGSRLPAQCMDRSIRKNCAAEVRAKNQVKERKVTNDHLGH